MATVALEPVSNDGLAVIEGTMPFMAACTLRGTSPMLFHRWSVESVATKAAAAKGSAAKKTDDIESYVYRDPETKYICLPGEYVRQAVINAAKFRQDPRSPRKSAMDLFKAAVISLTEYAPITPAKSTLPTTEWDFLDQRRVMVQRAGVTRQRPGFAEGWTASFSLQVQLPEYISSKDLLDVLVSAGKLIGVGDFRPTYGRFAVTAFDVVD